jgi:flagella basal body P-ring formation protein FlgA
MRRLIFSLCAFIPFYAAAQEQSQPMWTAADLRHEMMQWLSEHDVHVDDSTHIGPLDERLQLAACTQLDIAARSARSSSYIVRCHAPQSWDYVLSVMQDGRGVTMARASSSPPQASAHKAWTVVVPRVSLPSGAVLSAQDIEERTSDVYPGSGALKSIAEATGLRLTGTVSAGTVLNTYNVAKAPLVMKGESVTLVATGQGFDISAPGTAEEDGYRGDLISVRNLKTGVVLRGRVAEGKIIAVASFL